MNVEMVNPASVNKQRVEESDSSIRENPRKRRKRNEDNKSSGKEKGNLQFNDHKDEEMKMSTAVEELSINRKLA
jgi:hypothetical protein